MKMRIFIRKVFVYSIPALLIFVFPFILYIVSKEYFSLEKIVKLQHDRPETLYGFSYYGEPHVPYKLLLLQTAKPDVLVLGTSRAFQIRKEFFVSPENYLNIAVPRPFIDLSNMNVFINSLPDDKRRRTLFLLLDKRYFTEEYGAKFSIEEDSFVTQFKKLVGKPLRLIYLDYFSHKYTLRDLFSASLHSDNRIGLWSLIADTGYRVDGTHQEMYNIQRPERMTLLQEEVRGRVDQIKHYDSNLLQKEEALIPTNISALRDILRLCKERNITVIGFIPPDPKDVSFIINKGDTVYSQSQIKLTKDISSVFLENSQRFFDLSSIQDFGGNDDEFIDMIHGGDLLYARAFLYMVNQDKSLKKYIDVQSLQKMIQSSKGDFLSSQ